MAISAEHKDMLSHMCNETLTSIDKEMKMVEEEVERMRAQPSRCPVCDYERMVKTRHYLWETIHEVLAVKGLIG